MLGYVQTDTANYWITELTKRFDNDLKKQLSITQKLSQVTIHPDLTDEWLSSHTRVNGTPLMIFHLFLDCRDKSDFNRQYDFF